MFHVCVIPLSVLSKFLLLRALHANVSERGYITATDIVCWLKRNDHLFTRFNSATALEAKVTNLALKLTPLSRNWHVSCSKDSGVEYLQLDYQG
jgi:hypothetical protein